MNPEVSVVVATHDRPERLALLLAGLRRQTLDPSRFEIVVVDDASGPATGVALKAELERTPNLRVVRRDVPGGAGAARETGRRAASGAIIAFTDDDCEPGSVWLEAILAALAPSDGAFVQGPTLPNPREISASGPLSRTINLPGPSATYNTCNIAYPAALLDRIGGFDIEAFGSPGAWGEDTDLAWRAIGVGAEARFADDAVVHHAIEYFGVAKMLREARRWAPALRCFARHPGLRRTQLHRGIFWKPTHELLVLAMLSLVPRIPWLLRLLLLVPYVRSVRGRCISEGGGLRLAPFYLAYDVLETAAISRGALRNRTPVI